MIDASGNLIAQYLFGDGLDSNIARFRPGEGTAWYLADQLGSVRDIVDANGLVINEVDYDSFGNILSETNSDAGDRFKFNGREYEPELGLYYYRARFYDATTGRFLSQDPIGFTAGDANLYRYVGNQPLTFTDPTGLTATTEFSVTVDNNAKNASKYAIVGCLANEFFTASAMALIGVPPDALDVAGAVLCFVNPGAAAADNAADLAKFGNKLNDIDNTKDASKAAKNATAPKGVKLTGKGRRKIGNLAEIKDKDAAQAILDRGGTASNVRKALGDNLKGKTVGEIANLAAKGNAAAETALKIIKQAAKKGQR